MSDIRSDFFINSNFNCPGNPRAKIVPSLLAADFSRLGEEIARLESTGIDVLHLDIMDGHFVPNLSFGVPVVESIRRVTDLPLDVHLMLDNPEPFLVPFRNAGADSLTVHIEVLSDPVSTLSKIHDLGAGAGLAISPPTDVRRLEPYLEYCDLVLTMSVMPGFGGQTFDRTALDKLTWLKNNGPQRLWRSVDGGVNPDTMVDCIKAGANFLVMGTALLGHRDYDMRMGFLRSFIGLQEGPDEPSCLVK